MTKAGGPFETALTDDAPPGWRLTTLGEIGEYINGRGFKKSEWAEKGLPIIRIQNLTGTGKEQNFYDGEIDERHVVNPGDLLISWAATLGAYFWAGPRAALNQHIFKVRSFVDKRFHYYLMQHILGDLYRQTHGSGMVHITKSKFDSTPIVVPETEDQQNRIVAEIEKQFSRVDEAITNLKRAKANLKRYKAAVLKAAIEGRLVETEAALARREGRSYETGEQLVQSILESRRSLWQGKSRYKEPTAPDTANLPELPEGWTWATIGQATECLDSMRVPVNKKERLNRVGDVPYYGANGRVGYIDTYIFDEPLVLVVEDETFTGREIPFSYKITGKSWVNNHAHVLRPTGMVNLDYLNDALSYYPFTALTTGTTGRKKLTQLALVTAPLRIPPLLEQQRIVIEVERRLSITHATEAQVDVNLQRAERQRQAILMRAFNPSTAGNMVADNI